MHKLSKKTQPDGSTISYSYDGNGNRVDTTIVSGTTTVDKGFGYNPLDELVTLTRNGVNLSNITYDERGNLASIKNSNGTYTGFEYDGANQLILAKNYDAKGNVINSFSYSYDANGNRSSVVTPSGTINYKYDELNQLIE